MTKSKEGLCSQGGPRTTTLQLRDRTSSPLPMSPQLRTYPITASTMIPGPPALPLIQNLLKNTRTQLHQSLPAAPDTPLMLEKKMLIRTTGAHPNVHDVDLLAADDLLILAFTNWAFLRPTRRTSLLI